MVVRCLSRLDGCLTFVVCCLRWIGICCSLWPVLHVVCCWMFLAWFGVICCCLLFVARRGSSLLVGRCSLFVVC